MRLRITKLFAVNHETRVCDSAQLLIGREHGQLRKVTGCIGDTASHGSHILDVRGTGKLEISIEPGTTLHIQPWD